MTTIPHSRSADFPQGVYAHQINDEVHFGFVGGWTKQKKTVERDGLAQYTTILADQKDDKVSK